MAGTMLAPALSPHMATEWREVRFKIGVKRALSALEGVVTFAKLEVTFELLWPRNDHSNTLIFQDTDCDHHPLLTSKTDERDNAPVLAKGHHRRSRTWLL